MANLTLKPGLTFEVDQVVLESHTAAQYGSGLAPVLSTPHLVALFENACARLVEPHLEKGKSTVGSLVSVKHLAPTPVGMKVNVKVELISVEGPKLKFKGTAQDEAEKIGECEHERFVITYDRFMNKVNTKAAAKKTAQ